ncbi:MAG: SGNH/GDSL hydrolase family protein [Proteobacteria bacterium]|nr:SGNH/GDSL hydrolase family protein [Pseudomonadota bacterium]MBU1740930.1 SGNH/GDSL hydrolase family protein [Pseudomonadota bacterium]
MRLVLIWLIVLGGAALAAEAALRFLAPHYGSLYFSLTRTGGHVIHYSRHGLRDPERPLAKPAGTIRVLALGDSVTWGYGVGDRDLYVRLIERRWNREGRRPRLEIWNMAGMGRSARMYVPHLRRLLAYRPDAVIIQINLNDVGDAFRPTHRGVPITTWETPGAEQARKLKASRTPWGRILTSPAALASHLRLWLTRTHLGAWLIVQATRLSYRLGLRKKDHLRRNRHEFMAFSDDREATRSWIEFAVNLVRLTQALRFAGVRVMWVVFPYRYQVDRPRLYLGVDPKSFPVEPQERIVFLARWLKVPVLDLLPVFVRARRAMRAGRTEFRRLFLLLDANHPDRYGHALAARAIDDFIRRRRWLSDRP